jgi:hypothetical protein
MSTRTVHDPEIRLNRRATSANIAAGAPVCSTAEGRSRKLLR